MNISINKKSRTPVYQQIVEQIKTSIIKGELFDGFPLQSERRLASTLDVHRNTIRRAYSDLSDSGLIEPCHGVGYRVSYRTRDMRDDAGGNKPAKAPRLKKVNWTNTIKDEYVDLEITFDDLFSKSYSQSVISFAGGMASPDAYKRKEVAESLTEILMAKNDEPYFYTPYQGDYKLRREIVAFLRGKGIMVNSSELQILSESNQALDFIVTMLLKPGDTVLTEEPVSPDVYRALTLAGANVVTVPIDENGMICENLGPLIEKHSPRFIYVNSSYHDPAGVLLSLERRNKLLELSYKYRIPIVEDDAASELSYEGNRLPSIKSLDKGDNVIYIYSFALTLIPGLSIAFVAAAKPVIKSLSYLVSIRLINLDWVSQKLLESYLRKGIYAAKTAEMRKSYKEKRELMCSWLDKLEPMGVTYLKPNGGVYVWCTLPQCVDVYTLAADALKRGVTFIPGNVFYPGKKGGNNNIRLNYSHPSLSQIDDGMAILIELISKFR